MGIELAKQLFARHAHALTAGELTVLGYMCLVALDRENEKGQPPRMFFGGRDCLAVALGYDPDTAAGRQKVKRAVSGLVAKGLLEPTNGHARVGNRQAYRINVGPFGRGTESDPLRGTESDPLRGTTLDPQRGTTSDPPRTHTGTTEDLRQDISIQSVTELQTARARRKK